MQIAERVALAENVKTGLHVVGSLADLPRFDRIRTALWAARTSAAPGPDRVAHLVYSDPRSAQWGTKQVWALAVKQTVTLVAPIQSRGGGLFALWEARCYHDQRCLAPRHFPWRC